MSSSVSNPYTFNIQRDTAFSTRINKGIVDTFTTICQYNESNEYKYNKIKLECVNLPELASGHILDSIRTYKYQIPGGAVSSFTSVVFIITYIDEFPYSKIILNGGPFNTVELPKSDSSTEDYVIYECNTAYIDKTYDNATIELSITYVD